MRKKSKKSDSKPNENASHLVVRFVKDDTQENFTKQYKKLQAIQKQTDKRLAFFRTYPSDGR